MGHTTPNTLKISIRLYELIKVTISVSFPGLPDAAVTRGGVIHSHRDDLLQ